MLNSFPFSESLLTLMFSRRSAALTSALLSAVRSPVTLVPARFTPRYVNTGMICYLLFLSRLSPDWRFAAQQARRGHPAVNQIL